MIMELFFRGIVNPCARLKGRVFHDDSQAFIIVLAGIMLIVGAIMCLSPTSFIQIFATVFLGAGSSILATALTVKLTNHEGDMSSKAIWGLKEIRSADGYEWDNWIRRIPNYGELIIVGIRNDKWFDKRATPLFEAIEKNVKFIFIFVGPEETVNLNIKSFKEQLAKVAKMSRKDLSRVILKKKVITDPDLPDYGFYWNGVSLIVKTNLPETEKLNAPMLCFDVGFPTLSFKKEHLREVAFKKPETFQTMINALDCIVQTAEPRDRQN
jgi:hypothetical protein